MNEPKWVKLIEVFERIHADLVESYFKAHGVETQIIQEAYFEYRIGSAAFGSIEILVPDFQLDEAKKLYEETGWNFDTTEIDEDENEDEDTSE